MTMPNRMVNHINDILRFISLNYLILGLVKVSFAFLSSKCNVGSIKFLLNYFKFEE